MKLKGLLMIGAMVVAAACQKSEPPMARSGSGSGSGSGSAAAPTAAEAPRRAGSGAGVITGAPILDIDSKDILARTTPAPEVAVKHVLLAWVDLLPTYGPRMDPRAAKRSNQEAAKLAQDLLAKLRADPTQIDALAKQYSEDPGSLTGDPYTVATDAPFVPEFKKLALRLQLDEPGIVRTKYGYHVIVRVTPPPPDPLQSADILARAPQRGAIEVQHVLIGWKDLPAAGDPRAKARTKADADKLATQILAKLRAGADMAKLMKEYSEDPGSKDTGRAYEVTKDAPLVEGFKRLSMRLEVGEAGMVKTEFGWHVIKRVPPDSLDSVDILAREPVTDHAKVKHILLGWTATHADDARGKQRTRAALEQLVKATLAKLKGGAPIEPLMKELSEDPGSAATGEAYDVTPAARLVGPFKNLALRLNKGEVGAVKTQFGIHIIQRVE